MHAQRFTRILIFMMLVLLAIIPARAVSAKAPVGESGSMDLNYLIEPLLCLGIEVWDHEVLTYHQTTYFDNQGNPTIIKVLYQGVDNFYNPLKPDLVLSGKFTGTIEFDPYTGAAIRAFGLPVHINLPGNGTVLLRAGLWGSYPDLHLAGKDSSNDPKDIGLFCSLMAGQ